MRSPSGGCGGQSPHKTEGGVVEFSPILQKIKFACVSRDVIGMEEKSTFLLRYFEISLVIYCFFMIFLSSFENHLKRIHNRNFTAALIEGKGGWLRWKKKNSSPWTVLWNLCHPCIIYIYSSILSSIVYPIHFINCDLANVTMTYFITEQQLQLAYDFIVLNLLIINAWKPNTCRRSWVN